MNPHLWVGLPGLATDIQTVKQKIEFRMNMYELKETRQMRPKTFANMVSNMLYERRFGPFFVEPIVAGLDPETHAPYICNMDLIGEKQSSEKVNILCLCQDASPSQLTLWLAEPARSS